MRAYELHASAKQIQRSKGRSSVAAAAYRSASRLVDERTGEIHDYTKKHGVEHTRIYTPENAPEWARDRAALWNACEAKENRSNSCVARELEIAFPSEFNPMQRREAGDAVSRELLRRYGCAVDIAYHAPNKQGDERNHHAHVLFTTRAFDKNTKDGWSKKKYRELNNDRIIVDGNTTTRGKEEVKALRAFTATEMNRIAERDRLQVITEHLSFEERGIDREPSQHMGNTATEMERNGKISRIGDENRAMDDRNNERAQQQIEAARVAAEITKERAKLQEKQRAEADKQKQSHVQKSDELKRAQDLQKRNLERDLRDKFSERKIAEQRQMLELKLKVENARGFTKLFRDISGMTGRDVSAHNDLRASLLTIKSREDTARNNLDLQHGREQQKAQERQEKERRTMDANQKRGRDEFERSRQSKARGYDHAKTKEQQRLEQEKKQREQQQAPQPRLRPKGVRNNEKLRSWEQERKPEVSFERPVNPLREAQKPELKRSWQQAGVSNSNEREPQKPFPDRGKDREREP